MGEPEVESGGVGSRGARPAFHFTPRSGWVNDPLAVTWRGGRYHLFFQHVPESTSWAAHCHWGHAVSTDLLTWEERPVALRPADDEAGCWSGSVVVPDGAPDGDGLLLYTSVRDEDLERGSVRLARPRRTDGEGDPWDHWVPGEVVARVPEDLDVVTFRDPVVVADEGGWSMLVGGGLAPVPGQDRGTACVFGFRSEDLLSWRSTGLVAARPGTATEPWTGTKWECPQLLRLGAVDVLVVSVCDEESLHHVVAAPGRLGRGRFTASAPWQRLTHGVPYAATAFTARDGRPALLTWLRDVADPAAGWAGALGLPLAVDVVGDRVVVDLLVDPGGLLSWEPGAVGVTVRDEGGAAVAALVAEADSVVLTPSGSGAALRLPRGEGPVRVVVDGPLAEVLHAGRYGAVPLVD